MFSEKLTGSINSSVRREVIGHLRGNAAARRTRYGLGQFLLRRFFSIASFGRFIIAYAFVNLALELAEICAAACPSEVPSAWTAFGGSEGLKSLILNVSSYFITAQVGVLGV
ncbi:hypothetical protein ACCT20_36715, partial [Rhizobium ruizarguesonis]